MNKTLIIFSFCRTTNEASWRRRGIPSSSRRNELLQRELRFDEQIDRSTLSTDASDTCLLLGGRYLHHNFERG